MLGPSIGIGIVKSEESIHLISEIGLLMLLFIIGLEIHLPDLMKPGKELFLLGFIQFVGVAGLVVLSFSISKFVLTRLFSSASSSPELVLLTAMLLGALTSTYTILFNTQLARMHGIS